MPTNADMPEHNDVIGLLREIHREQTRQGETITELNLHITGGHKPEEGLAFKVANLQKQDESRTFWMRTIGTTAVGSFIAAIGALLFKTGSTQ